MRTPGREAVIEFGPFGFGVNTADGGSVGFEVRLFGWTFGWNFGPSEPR
jgi:hypothetical protein